jgi:ubiquitin C-terminal hydrolase
MKDNKVNLKINLYNWKKKLFELLSSDNYSKRSLYLIIEQSFIDYLNKYLYDDNNSNVKDFGEIINITDLSKIKDSKTDLSKFPKLFVLNKDSIPSSQHNNIENRKLNSIFYHHLLRIEIKELIYCIFFLDKNNQLRQGYLRKKNTGSTTIELDNLYKFYEFIKQFNKEIKDDELIIKGDKFEIFVFKYKENEDVLKYIKEEKSEPKKSDFNISQKELKHINLKMNGNKDKMNNIYQFASSSKLTDMKSNQIKNIYKNNNEDTVNDLGIEILPKRHIVAKQRIKRAPSQNRISRESNKKLLRKSSLENFIPKRNSIAVSSTPGIIGLLNIGATCYMNATLQCFSNLSRFRMQLLNKDFYKDLEENKEDKKKLSFALAEVLKNLWENLNHKFYSPENFKNLISKMNKLFQGIAANDAKDLILFILQTMHIELNNPPNNFNDTNQVPDDREFLQVYNDSTSFFLSRNKSIISDEFYGFENSMTRCGNCQTIIHKVQAINIVFFPLEEVRKFFGYKVNCVRINECFEYYQRSDLIPSFFCNYCQYNTQGVSQTRFVNLPKTLIINLNRGKGLEFNINIIFEEYLNLRKYVYSPDSPHYYELTGVITHFGDNDSGGHFIAYCKNCNNCEWYKYNDQFVTICNFNEVVNNGLPYVLFYSYIQV